MSSVLLFRLCGAPLYGCVTVGLSINLLLAGVWVVSNLGHYYSGFSEHGWPSLSVPMALILLGIHLGVESLVRG